MKTELERYKEAVAYMLGELFRMHKGSGERVAADVERVLNPSPEMEEVEDYCWHVPSQPPRDAYFAPENYEQAQRLCLKGEEPVKLTGIYKRPKPQPVEKSVTAVVSSRSTLRAPHMTLLEIPQADIYPLAGTSVTISWREPSK